MGEPFLSDRPPDLSGKIKNQGAGTDQFATTKCAFQENQRNDLEPTPKNSDKRGAVAGKQGAKRRSWLGSVLLLLQSEDRHANRGHEPHQESTIEFAMDFRLNG